MDTNVAQLGIPVRYDHEGKSHMTWIELPKDFVMILYRTARPCYAPTALVARFCIAFTPCHVYQLPA